MAVMGCAFADNPLTDMTLAALLEVSDAEVAFTSLPPGGVALKPGVVKIRDLYSLSYYDNTLVEATVTGAQLRAILEHSARFYADWNQPKKQLDLISNKVFFFNCDLAAGIDYCLDLRQPAGRRVVDLRRNGHPLQDHDRVRVVVTNYRFNGGGSYHWY